MPRVAFLLLLALSMIFGGTLEGHAAKRVALVIGNSAYEHAPTLKNPKNDAAAISDVLNKLGFDVVMGIDLVHVDFARIVGQFRKKLKGADVGLFFYAGHGLQVNGSNYLAPIDAVLDSEMSLDFEAVQLRLILRVMERLTKTNLVFLDACRDNPLARNLARGMGTRSTNIGRGLARVESGIGTLIAYATQPGNVALDGKGTHSPFAAALLKHVETPGLEVEGMMRRVRREVIDATSGSQVPWSNSSLTGSFAFNPASQTAVSTASPVQDVEKTPAPAQQSAWAAFSTTERIGSCGAYKAFEEAYPDSFHGKLAWEWRQKNCKVKKKFASLQGGSTSLDARNAGAPTDPRELTLALQRELNRVGCNAGRADGSWGAKGRNALSRFNTHAKSSLPTDQPTAQAFETVKGKTALVCPAATKKPTSVQKKSAKVTPAKAIKEKSGVKYCNKACIVKRICAKGYTPSFGGGGCAGAKKQLKNGGPLNTGGISKLLNPGERYRP